MTVMTTTMVTTMRALSRAKRNVCPPLLASSSLNGVYTLGKIMIDSIQLYLTVCNPSIISTCKMASVYVFHTLADPLQ